MDRGSVKDWDIDAHSEPALSSEEPSLCQYSGVTRLSCNSRTKSNEHVMRPKITVVLQPANTSPTIPVGALDFAPPRTDEVQRWEIKDGTLPIVGDASLKITGNYTPASHQLNLAGFFKDEQIILVLLIWDKQPPFFGLRVTNFGFLHCYFDKS
jgi:hypothetical protein